MQCVTGLSCTWLWEMLQGSDPLLLKQLGGVGSIWDRGLGLGTGP